MKLSKRRLLACVLAVKGLCLCQRAATDSCSMGVS